MSFCIYFQKYHFLQKHIHNYTHNNMYCLFIPHKNTYIILHYIFIIIVFRFKMKILKYL